MQQQPGSAVNEDLQQLLSLQEVDEFIADARLKQRRLPEVVAAERTAFEAAEAALKEAEQTLSGHEAARREREASLVEQEDHIDRLKARLKEVSNTREYQAHIQEMDGVQRAVGQLEEEVLQILADIDSVTEELAGHRALFGEREEVYRVERAKVDAELGELEKEVVAHRDAKEKRAQGINPNLLRRYERITATVRRAVVAVEGGNCAGCNMSVPHQLVSEVKRGNGIHQCPHCHRLLFIPVAPVE